MVALLVDRSQEGGVTMPVPFLGAPDDIAEVAKVEAWPRLEGRQMLMVVSPK